MKEKIIPMRFKVIDGKKMVLMEERQLLAIVNSLWALVEQKKKE